MIAAGAKRVELFQSTRLREARRGIAVLCHLISRFQSTRLREARLALPYPVIPNLLCFNPRACVRRDRIAS